MPFITTLYFLTISGVLKTNADFILADTSIAKQGQLTAEKISSYFDAAWVEITTKQSHIFNSVDTVALMLAVMFVGFWAIPWIATIMRDGYSTKPLEDLILPLVILFMLGANNGTLIATSCQVIHETTNYVNYQILQETINGEKVDTAIQEVGMDSALQHLLWTKYDECQSLSKTEKNEQGVSLRDACVEDAINDVKKQAEELRQEEGLNLDGNIPAMFSQAIDYSVNAFKSELEDVLKIVLAAFQAAFVLLVEIAAILNVYISPLFFALALLPGQIKLLHAWLAGWLALGLMKVSYTIIIGIVATAVVKNEDPTMLWIPVLQAVLSPILAAAIAALGGMAIFNGLGSIGSGGMRMAIKAGTSRRRN